MSRHAHQPVYHPAYPPPPPKLVGRIARLITGTVLLISLGVACFTWVTVSQPFNPGQQAVPKSQLDPAVARAAAALPTGRGDIVALTYHGVSDTDHAATTVTRRVFAEHLAALSAAGYRTVRLADVEALLAGRPVALPRRALLLTFDGGQLTDWSTVDPMLKQYGYTAVAFLTTSKIVEPGTHSYYLSTRQITDLKATGRWEFGTRGDAMDNQVPVPGGIAPPLTNLISVDGRPETLDHWQMRVARDLAATRAFFRTWLHQQPTAFSYPWGETGATGNTPSIAVELPRLLAAAGFTEAFIGEEVPTDDFGTINARSAAWQLHRMGVRATTSAADLIEMIRTAIPAAPPRELATLPWLGDLATCTTRGQTLTVTTDTYGSCQLTGYNTSEWTDYTLNTTVSGVSAAAVAIVSVRDGSWSDGSGRVDVRISDRSVSLIEELGDGAKLNLGSAPLPGSGRTAREVTITLRGTWVRVEVNGTRTLTAEVDPRLATGGVDFAVSATGHHTVSFADPTVSPAVTAKIKDIRPLPRVRPTNTRPTSKAVRR